MSERLTERNEKGIAMAKGCGENCKYGFSYCRKEDWENCKTISDLIDKLAEYEDLEEQGLLLRLPCKVGDTVYYPEEDYHFVYPVRISQIIVSNLGGGKQCRQYNGCFFNCDGDPETEFEFEDDDFGKTVFITQPEAEEKLRELEGKYDGR